MRFKLMVIGLLLFSTLSIISGCASQKEIMIQQGYPSAYAEGFEDGCHSGHQAGGNLFEQFRKDVRRFDLDTQYAQGWSDGFRQCESEEQAAQRRARMAVEMQRLSEERERAEREEKWHLEREVMQGIDTSGLENLK